MSQNRIPIFFATDDNYAPYLAASIASLLSGADKSFFYDIHVLTSSMNERNRQRLSALVNDYSSISFDDVGERMNKIADRISLRDYYSVATYYRIFIADMFPEYDKALYVDSDTVILGDISKMFNTDIGDNLVGACQENVMLLDVFARYSKVVLGIPNTEYFNAGILLMNLKRFRQTDMEGRFITLLSRRRFPVAQDQDYLNVLCHGNVHYFPVEWNLDPVDIYSDRSPLIIHYKMHRRPWNYDGVLFGDYFWQYVEISGYAPDVIASKNARTEADAKKDTDVFDRLCDLAEKEISDVISGTVPCAMTLCPAITL